MRENLYREVVLERLNSPEQLDKLIKVTSPKAWLALIAVACILVSAVVWAVFGSLPTKIAGHGILLNNGGVFSLHHHTSGQVIDVRFKVGDMVKKGDVIARIDVPQLVAEINRLEKNLIKLKGQGGVATPQYQALENQVKKLREDLDFNSQIVSQIDGRILKLNINKGSIISQGEALVTLEQHGGKVKLEAVLYVPAEQGGVILPGMEAQISPTIVNKEEYGYMLGRVMHVSEYPATTKSMLETLGNENLVTMLSGKSAPLMVRIDLIPDANTKSGYRWSSPGGPPLIIQSGTIVQGAVVINREKPISKVIPLAGTTGR